MERTVDFKSTGNPDEGTATIYPVTIQYPSFFKKQTKVGSLEPSDFYGCTIAIAKTDTDVLDVLKKVILAVAKKKWGAKLPSNFRNPLRDGDAELIQSGEYEGQPSNPGNVFFRVKTKRDLTQTGILHIKGARPLKEDELRFGDEAIVSVRFFAYDTNGNRGVSAGISAIVKTADSKLQSDISISDLGIPFLPAEDEAGQIVNDANSTATALQPTGHTADLSLDEDLPF